MANINISGKEAIDDPEYRYKMPKLVGKVEGRGNGIKTALVNVRDVSNALHRSPEELTKFFGFELGAQTIWVDATDKSIVNGAHTDRVLQELIHKYIDIFVLCPNCRLPESDYKVKSGIVYHNCMACGGRESLDMSHKLTTFIINKHKKEKKEKTKDKKDKKSSKEKTPSDDSKSKKKSKRDKKEKKERRTEGSKSDSESKASLMESEELNNNRSDSESDEFVATNDNVEVDEAGAFDTCVMSISRYVEDKISPEQMVEELRTAQTFSAFPVQYRVHLYIASAFQKKTSISENDIKDCSPVLKLLSREISNPRHLIGAFELLTVRNPALKQYFPIVLKFLYDFDFAEEDVIIAWAEQGYSEEFTPPGVSEEVVESLVKLAEPFITWLREAEEEED